MLKRLALSLLLVPSLALQTAPRLTILEYYRLLPYGALPYFDEKPTVVDAANGYLRLGNPPTPRSPRFSEVAVWRAPDGSVLIGANYQTPPGGPGCGDETCASSTRFFRYRSVDPHETRETTLNGKSRNWTDVTADVFFTTPAAVATALRQKLQQLGIRQTQPFGASEGQMPYCILYFPRQGTSIRVALYTGPEAALNAHDQEITVYQVGPALRNKDLTLCWLKWQQGKFVASLVP